MFLFSNIGSLHQELNKYFHLYNIYLTEQVLCEYVKTLQQEYLSGNSVFKWLIDIIPHARKAITKNKAVFPSTIKVYKSTPQQRHKAKLNYLTKKFGVSLEDAEQIYEEIKKKKSP